MAGTFGNASQDIQEQRTTPASVIATLLNPEGATRAQMLGNQNRTDLVQGAAVRQLLGGQGAVASPGASYFAPRSIDQAPPPKSADIPLMGQQDNMRVLQTAAPQAFNAAALQSIIARAFPATPVGKDRYVDSPGGLYDIVGQTVVPGTAKPIEQSEYVKDLVAAGIKPGTAAFNQYMDARFNKNNYVEGQDPLKRAQLQSQIDRNDAQAQATASGKLTGDSLDLAAEQMLAGDTSAMQSLGYGALGSANRSALRNRVTELAKERGMTGADIAAMNAEYFGTKAGERTLGTRSANIDMAVNEASNMGSLVREASDKMPRGQWMPVNKAMQAWNEGTGMPEARTFGAAVNSFLNAYATAVGKGTMTVDARNHAQELLSTADGPRALEAIMNQLDKEMDAAKAAPGQVRSQLRGAITGRGEEPQTAAPRAQQQGYAEGTIAARTNADGSKTRIILRGGQWQPLQ